MAALLGHSRAGAASRAVAASQACPLDLHTLLPIPAALLQRGPSHPDALAWLLENWGLTDWPRQIAERPHPSTGRRLPSGHAAVGYGFFTDGSKDGGATSHIRWCLVRFRRPGRCRFWPYCHPHCDA